MSEVEKATAQWAKEAYAKHELDPSSKEGEWLIHRPKDSQFWTRIIARPPYLICVGDAETCVFNGHPSDRNMPGWIAQSNLDYLAQKCSIAMGDSLGEGTDADKARDDIRWYLKQEDYEEDWGVFIEALEYLEFGVARAQQHIGETLDAGWEIAGTIGKVVSSRVIYAQAACRKLVELLEQEGQSLSIDDDVCVW